MYYPGYDRLRQAVSDLTAINAPSFAIASGLSSIYGLFGCLCCTLVCIIVYENSIANRTLRLGVYLFAVMNWISGIGYSLFPLSSAGYSGTLQDIIHMYVVTVPIVVLSILSLILIIIGGTTNKETSKTLPIFAAIALLCMFVGAVGVNTVPSAYFGIMERFSTYSAVVFNGLLGLYGFRFFHKVKNVNTACRKPINH